MLEAASFFFNMIHCIHFPYIVYDFSFVSIKLAAHQPRMESMSGCGSVPSVAILVPKILILSASNNIIIILLFLI